MPWTTIRVQVTTPLFNGGASAQPDADGGLRVSSLRGAMRYWFRALAGIGVGDNLAGLARLESRVFGTTHHASPVKLRILDPPPVTADARPDWCDGPDGRPIIYLLGQGHGDLRDRTVTKPYVEPGTDIHLQARFGDDAPVASAMLASLWLLCTYGGIGARTRRGFGGLRIVDVDGDLPTPWTPDTLRSPGMDFYQKLTNLWPTGPIGACMLQIKNIAERGNRDDPPVPFALGPANAAPPAYPMFSKQHTAAGLSGGDPFLSWHGALAHAGEQLRFFRARKSTPGVPYHPQVKTPEWLEVVHGEDSRFGLGALGLPVVYKEGYTVNAHGPSGELRRASPLWLRPAGADRNWRLLSFAFRCTLLPDDARIELRHGPRHVKYLTTDRADVVTRTAEWIDSLAADEDFATKLYP
jgi:CRISPR-associated protein Cmr1